jgi:RNA polymerase sigma-70 factor (ECF subfamily)
MQSSEMQTAIDEAIASLPEPQRLALVMFAIEGIAQKDVAEAMECSVEMVKWNVFQARKKLKELLAEHMVE